MARVTYGFLAAAAVSLITGFFVKGSSLPLWISVALSVAVAGLILAGWRRRQFDEGLGEGDEAVEELDVGEDEIVDAPTERRAPRDDTIEISDDALFAPPKRAAPKAKPKAKPKARASERKPAAAKPSPVRNRVAVVPGASRYHRPGCRFARGANVRVVAERIAKERGYLPCNTCKP